MLGRVKFFEFYENLKFSTDGMNSHEIIEILKTLYFFNKVTLRSLNLIFKRCNILFKTKNNKIKIFNNDFN